MILKAEFANGSARPFHVATKEELGGFDPVPGDCHGNAQRWVACPALASWANGSPRGVEMPSQIEAERSAVPRAGSAGA